jgi:hypothetical protein
LKKKPVQPDNKPAPPQKKDDIPKSAAKKTGTLSHLRLFFTSLGSLRSVLNERSKQAKKVEHIDELLDKTVSEMVKSSAPPSTGNVVDTKIASPVSGGGAALKEQEKAPDPFLSLSENELDVGLLDGLDEQETPKLPSSGQIPTPGTPVSGPSLVTDEHEIPMPSLDASSQPDDALKYNVGGLDEFRGLEGGESIDHDFGDLDNVNLGDIDLSVDRKEEAQPATGSSPSPSKSPIKTEKADLITHDVPRDADLPEDEITDRSDMASLAGGAPGSDADLLSSLALDVSHVVKEKNTSLLRDLKDFKAPATEIENELNEVYDKIKTGENSGKKVILPHKKTK